MAFRVINPLSQNLFRFRIKNHSPDIGKSFFKYIHVDISFFVETRNHDRFFRKFFAHIIHRSEHIWYSYKTMVFVFMLLHIFIHIRTVNHFFAENFFFFRRQLLIVHQFNIHPVKSIHIPFSDLKTSYRNMILHRESWFMIIFIPVSHKFFDTCRQYLDINARFIQMFCNAA